MQTKCFEIRDRGTFIPALAVILEPDGLPAENYLLRRAGYRAFRPEASVLLLHLQTGEAHVDYYDWGSQARTMPNAHKYIQEHFDSLEGGSVIDVEVILGEKKIPSVSERFSETLGA